MDPKEFHQRCSTMNTLLDEADRKFRAWLSGISIAYSDAWERHNSKTKEIEESLKEDFALDAALLFLGGVGGNVAGRAIKRAMKLGKDNDSPILAGLTKLSDKGVEWGLSKAHVDRKLPTFPVSPFRWKNTISARVDSELGIVTEQVRRWQEAVDNKDPNFKTDFDPHQAVREVLEAVNTAELQKEFERGFLAYWLLETAPFGNSMGSMQVSQPPQIRAAYYSSGPLLPSSDFEDVVSYGQQLGLTEEATQLLIFAGMDKWMKK